MAELFPLHSLLVTGAGGNLGRGLVSSLVDSGWRVRCLVLPGDRAADELQHAGAETIIGDVSRREDLSAAVQDMDCVLHMAGVILHHDPSRFDIVNHLGTVNLLRASEDAGVRHFVHISSISVTYKRLTPYGRSKKLGEEAVRSSSLPWTVVRPTLLVSERGGEEFRRFLHMVKTFSVLPLPGGGRSCKRPLYEDDARNGLLGLMAAVRAQTIPASRIYNLAGADVVTTAALVQLCAKSMKISRRRILPVPSVLVRRISDGLSRYFAQPWAQAAAAMDEDAAPSIEDAARDFGHAPKPMEQWLPGCVRSIAAIR